MKPKLANWILFILMLLLVNGCQTNRKINTTSKQFSKFLDDSLDDSFINDSILQIRRNINSNLPLAKAIATEINYLEFTNHNVTEYFLLRASIDIKEYKYEKALSWLNKPIINKVKNANHDKQISLLKAVIYSNLYKYETAFKYWFNNTNLTDSEINNEQLDLLWSTLLSVPEINIIKQLNKNNSSLITSMLELALIFQQNKKYDIPPETAIQSLNSWKQKWSMYRSIRYLPNNSEALLFANLDNIAVLLPLTGPLSVAGRDIQEGIITAHFESKAKSPEQSTINLQFYDTNKQEINEIIALAKSNNCNAIIGPLDKNVLNNISMVSLSNITFITLNNFLKDDLPKKINKIQKYDSNKIYQFSLAAENEVLALTKSARSKGHEKAIIVVPDTPQGEKTGDLYQKYWIELGGYIVDYIKFTKTTDFANMFGSIMHIDDSNLRINNVKAILGSEIDASVSAESNADVLFLAASPEKARQIKPSMSYQFAKNISVFATSGIYADIPSKSNDTDLDEIRIPAYSWQNINFNSDLKNKVLAFKKKRNQNKNLYALGIDSYNLLTQINKLTFFKNNSIQGLTGILQTNHDLKIIKTLPIMKFKNGKLVP